MSRKNKFDKNEDSLLPENHEWAIPKIILRLSPLLLAFAAGVSVAWFNMNSRQEPQKADSAREALEHFPPLEQIVTQGKTSALDQAREYNAQGLFCFGQKRYTEAEASFEKAVELCPHYEIALGNLFNAKFTLKKYDEAIILLQRLQNARDIGFQEDLRKCYLAHSAHLLLQDQPAQAQEKIEDYFRLKPADDAFQDGANLYLKIAGWYFARDDFENSVKVGERILELVPSTFREEQAKLHSNLAISYYGLAEQKKDANYLKSTQEHIRKARELDPGNEKIKEISEKCERLFESIEKSKR